MPDEDLHLAVHARSQAHEGAALSAPRDPFPAHRRARRRVPLQSAADDVGSSVDRAPRPAGALPFDSLIRFGHD